MPTAQPVFPPLAWHFKMPACCRCRLRRQGRARCPGADQQDGRVSALRVWRAESSSVAEQPPHGEGEPGPYQPVGPVRSVRRVFPICSSGGRCCCGGGGEPGGLAQGAGGAVGVQGLQVFRGGGYAGDRVHVAVIPCGVGGYLREQGRRPEVGLVDDGLARGGPGRPARRSGRAEVATPRRRRGLAGQGRNPGGVAPGLLLLRRCRS